MVVDIVAGTVVVAALGGAITYIVKSKKSGKKCIGCPYADSCRKNSCKK